MGRFTITIAQEWIGVDTLVLSVEAKDQAEAEAKALEIAKTTDIRYWDEGEIEPQEYYVEDVQSDEVSDAA